MLTFLSNVYRGTGPQTNMDGIAPLLFRLFLAPIMLQSGWRKLVNFDSTVAWFDQSLNLPIPEVMAALATGTELIGGVLLIFGLGIRLIAIPLFITMVVAAISVHWDNGWLTLSDASSWLANERVLEAAEKKQRAIAILREHGNYKWLTSSGRFTILNNGIEYAAIYSMMLLSLFFSGGGRYLSADYWINRVRRIEPTQSTE